MAKQYHLSFLGCVEIFAIIFTFILPFKFSTIAMMPAVPLPFSFFYVLIGMCPNGVFTMLSGFLLLLVLLDNQKNLKFNKYSLFFIAICASFPLISAIGFINASVYEYAFTQVSYVTGLATYAIAMFLLLNNSKNDFSNKILWAITLSSSILIIHGLYQYFYGFADAREALIAQSKTSGVDFIKGNFKTRLMSARVKSTFAISNSFAAHILLTLPIILAFFYKKAKNIEETYATRCILLYPFILIGLVVLYLTSSRAGVVCFIISLATVFFAIYAKKQNLFKSALIAIIIIFIIFFLSLFAVRAYFDFGAAVYRADYCWAAIKIFSNNILLGTGWGDFFHEYTQIKLLNNTEAPRLPHNMILSLASQVGIFGFISSIIFLCYPLYVFILKLKKIRCRNLSSIDFIPLAIITGFLAWAMHSLCDFNLQIPSTMCYAILLVLIFLNKFNKQKQDIKNLFVLKNFILLFAICALYLGYISTRNETAFFDFKMFCDPRFKTKQEYQNISIGTILKEFEKVHLINPKSPFIYIEVAHFAISKRQFLLAEQYIKKAIQYSPERASLYHKLGNIQTYINKNNDAKKNFEIAKKLFPFKYDNFKKISK